ncbi:MAG: LLM class flavin-dependent oxidoreductase [Acidimicrobiales bacterium]
MRTTLWLDTSRPAADLLSMAAAAESAGWDGLRVDDTPDSQECWALAGALASAVPRVRIEVVVDPAQGRHPAVVAKLASTVDQLSGGRLLLGFLPERTSVGDARLAEAVQVVKRLAPGQPATWRGQFYRLQDAPLDPPTVQHPFPVMLVGGTAAQAAAWADAWTLFGPPASVADHIGDLVAACAAVGRDPATIALSVFVDEPSSLGSARSASVPATADDRAASDARGPGVVEVVIGDAALGADPAQWPTALARLRQP